jgi:hypothetical protein
MFWICSFSQQKCRKKKDKSEMEADRLLATAKAVAAGGEF